MINPPPLSATSAEGSMHSAQTPRALFQILPLRLLPFDSVFCVLSGGGGEGKQPKKPNNTQIHHALALLLRCMCRVRQTFPARLSEQWRRQFLRAPSFLPPSLRLPSTTSPPPPPSLRLPSTASPSLMPVVSLDGRAHRNRGRNVLHIQPHNVHEQWPSIR